MDDKIEKFGNSILQHGKFNDRIYLMKLDSQDVPQIIPEIERLATKNNYAKVFAKIPATFLPLYHAFLIIKQMVFLFPNSGMKPGKKCRKMNWNHLVIYCCQQANLPG